MDLPMGLTSALESGNCVLFVDAGAGHHASLTDGTKAPDASTLAERLAAHFRFDIGDEHDRAKVAQVAQIRKGRPDVIAFLEKQLINLEPDEHLLWLLSRTWRAIFTTNYDSVIERCYELISNCRQDGSRARTGRRPRGRSSSASRVRATVLAAAHAAWPAPA